MDTLAREEDSNEIRRSEEGQIVYWVDYEGFDEFGPERCQLSFLNQRAHVPQHCNALLVESCRRLGHMREVALLPLCTTFNPAHAPSAEDCQEAHIPLERIVDTLLISSTTPCSGGVPCRCASRHGPGSVHGMANLWVFVVRCRGCAC